MQYPPCYNFTYEFRLASISCAISCTGVLVVVSTNLLATCGHRVRRSCRGIAFSGSTRSDENIDGRLSHACHQCNMCADSFAGALTPTASYKPSPPAPPPSTHFFPLSLTFNKNVSHHHSCYPAFWDQTPHSTRWYAL